MLGVVAGGQVVLTDLRDAVGRQVVATRLSRGSAERVEPAGVLDDLLGNNEGALGLIHGDAHGTSRVNALTRVLTISAPLIEVDGRVGVRN